MSTTAQILVAPAFARPRFAPKPPRPQSFKRPAEPRRPSESQGRALELISHAIEHLVDSRLDETWDTPADAEAVHMLMACSRAVFLECEVVLSWQQRLQRAAMRRMNWATSAPR
ncbi:MAG: hypothetical protein V4734_01050 [Terriglobus sp.]